MRLYEFINLVYSVSDHLNKILLINAFGNKRFHNKLSMNDKISKFMKALDAFFIQCPYPLEIKTSLSGRFILIKIFNKAHSHYRIDKITGSVVSRFCNEIVYGSIWYSRDLIDNLIKNMDNPQQKLFKLTNDSIWFYENVNDYLKKNCINCNDYDLLRIHLDKCKIEG